jgi:hypothetical protein
MAQPSTKPAPPRSPKPRVSKTVRAAPVVPPKPMPNSSTGSGSSVIWKQACSWVVVGVLVPILLSCAVQFMTVSHPYAADVFYAIAAVMFVAKLWTWEDARQQSGSKKIQVGVAAITGALLIAAMMWNHSINAIAPLNTNLSIFKFDRGPYEAGKRAFVSVYLQYNGDAPATVNSYEKVGIIGHLSEKAATAEGMTALQDGIWREFTADSGATKAAEFTVPPKLPVWFTTYGPILSIDQANDLAGGKGAFLLFMGVLKWTDGKGSFELDYCGYTDPNAAIYHLCTHHNGPAKPH